MTLVAVTVALIPVTLSAQTPDFVRDDYPSSPGTRAIVKGDFDGNGWTDVALANTGRNTVALLLNLQDGNTGYKFWKANEWAVGVGPFDMTAGDFNRDGVTDLAVANADGNTIAIMIGSKGGPMSISQIAASGNPRGIETADIDRDGIPDLIYTAYQANTVTVLFGDGAGHFAVRLAGTAVGPQPQGVVAGDFNNDGRTDLAIANAGGGLSLLTGDGTGRFTRRNITGAQNLNVLAAADLNHDGWLDVAAASQSSGAVGVYLGAAAGLSPAKIIYPVGAASPRGITIADVNHDGWLEILAANRASSTVTVLVGAATKTDMYSQTIELAAGTGSRDVVTADFNHDGRLDIATGNEISGATTILTNVTHLDPAAFAFDTVQLGGAMNDCGAGSDRLVAADFNHNGRTDLATSVGCGHAVSVLLDGESEVRLTVEGAGGLLHVADLNCDGHPDLLLIGAASVSATTTDLIAFIGDGRGGFTQIVAATALGPNGYYYDLADVNRDGILDAVVVVTDYVASMSKMQVMLGRGDGTFRLSSSIPLPVKSSGAILADANGDGKIDALVVASAGYAGVILYSGNGNGGFSPVYEFNVASPADVMTGDVNEDGVVDIVFSHWNEIHLFAGKKTGGFAADVVETGQTARALVDMNGDGHLDLVGQVDDQTIAFGRGDGVWDPPAKFRLGPYGDTMIVADYNGDGLPDLLFTRVGYSAMINTRRTVNRPPIVDAEPDRDLPYDFAYSSEEEYELWAQGKDPDSHALTYEWRNDQGQILSHDQYLAISTMPHGPHRFTVTAYDGRGGSASDDIVITIVPAKEIVIHMIITDPHGTWQMVDDTEAASRTRVYNPNKNTPKITQALASPQNYVDIGLFADPTQTYKLWIRGKAENNAWSNDSAFIQFTGAVDPSGNAAWQIGTTSALEFNLEECSGCGLSGWGWEDDAWGAVNKNGTLLRFPQGGYQRIRIQTREDGLSIDQIVLSAEKYLTTRPGTTKNDKTILRYSQY